MPRADATAMVVVHRICPTGDPGPTVPAPSLRRQPVYRGRVGFFGGEENPEADGWGAVRSPGREVVETRRRDVEAGDYVMDGPVVVGPGSPPEDGSCGQFAVQFHVTTATVAGLKRIAAARGVSVPELCRQVVGVFVAQQEGELGALLAAEAEAAAYRPSLGSS